MWDTKTREEAEIQENERKPWHIHNIEVSCIPNFIAQMMVFLYK